MGMGKGILIIGVLLLALWYFAPDKFNDGRDTLVDKAGNFSFSLSRGESISEEQQFCVDEDGGWKTFLNECADICGIENCTQALTDSCDCGLGMCWDPDEGCIDG